MTTVPATTRRLFAAWIAGAFLLLGLPVNVYTAAASPAASQGQVLRPEGLAGAPKLRVERPSDPRLARPAEHLRLIPRFSDVDHHSAVLPSTPTLRAPRYLGLAALTPGTSADSEPAPVARGRGPPVPAVPSAGPDAFLGRLDVPGAPAI